MARAAWRGRWVWLLGLGAAAPLVAQQPAGFEAGITGLLLAQRPALLGGGVYAAARPEGRTRVALLLGAGGVSGRTVGRGELAVHYLLSPGPRHGVGFYAAGGVAGQVGPGRDQGYLLLGLGAEWAPGGGSGWAMEAGVAGGFRLALGWRWRWLHRAVTGPP